MTCRRLTPISLHRTFLPWHPASITSALVRGVRRRKEERTRPPLQCGFLNDLHWMLAESQCLPRGLSGTWIAAGKTAHLDMLCYACRVIQAGFRGARDRGGGITFDAARYLGPVSSTLWTSAPELRRHRLCSGCPSRQKNTTRSSTQEPDQAMSETWSHPGVQVQTVPASSAVWLASMSTE